MIISFLGYIPFDPPNEEVSERCLYYRKITGITRQQMADILELDEHTIKRIEAGVRRLIKKTIGKLELLNVMIDKAVTQ